MKKALQTRLYERELDDVAVRSKRYRKLYSDRQLIADLDIVNELDGHSGCVNALSWSKSGHLLASGSDDQHLNIHAYQPSDTNNQFRLQATVATGHTQNIFSVKFMPHHGDRTVITAAGDGEVRIFDLEYGGHATTPSAASTLATEGRRRGRHNIYDGVKYLSDGDTGCKVYRSHGDRVKRIVTESSPHLFLTCSEDGEVRQWDLRQPSSAYPDPRGGRFGSDISLPSALISYKRYYLDLNTISCSASQSHYIAVGGAHLHAFLHDRRMTGRDRLQEAGRPLPPIDQMSEEERELMSQATQCVKKFAPDGRGEMKQSDTGHITACKISDARPDEMVVSWSADHIYSFDLHRDPPTESSNGDRKKTTGRVQVGRDRKRKRNATGSETSLDQGARSETRPRAEPDRSLRIHYQNGQSEDIPIPHREPQATLLTDRQRDAQRIARSTVKIRVSMFEHQAGTDSAARFTTSINHAAAILSDIDEAVRDWGYPLDPSQEQVLAQQTLRFHREKTRRFVQAAGTLARALGGTLQTASGSSPMLMQFAIIDTKRNDKAIPQAERFRYDFLKAILLWLDSGLGQLIEGFTRPADMPASVKAAARLPIPESEASVESIDDILIPYLLDLASDEPIINVETNRFQRDTERHIFATERAAVQSFAAVIKIPFGDLSSAVARDEGVEKIRAQDRRTAHQYWARKVARGLLLGASQAISYELVDLAFGGLGGVPSDIVAQEARLDQLTDESGDEEAVRGVDIVTENGDVMNGANAENLREAARESQLSEETHALLDDDDDEIESQEALYHLAIEEEEEEDSDEDDEGEDVADTETDSDPDEEDGVPNSGIPRFIARSAFDRRRLRPKVEAGTPCARSTRKYRGHCNIRTVKDVNYFGPDDDYVVSGSDDGNFFIWDRKTGALVNILEGDGEIVNVVQGHPYETLLAVSGIDHTIKIFSPDARAREVARFGQGVFAHDASEFSSLSWPRRLGGGRRLRTARDSAGDAAGGTESEPALPTPAVDEPTPEDDAYVAPNGLTSRRRMHDRYRITAHNELEREGGNQDAVMTRAMLQQLAQRIRAHRAATTAAAAESTEDGREPAQTIVLDDDCTVQ